MPPSESSPFQHRRYTSQDSQCAPQNRNRVYKSVRVFPALRRNPPPLRRVFYFPRVTAYRSNRHENASFHTGFGAHTWICGARICWGRDYSEERCGLRKSWRHMGCCNERMFREKDVGLFSVWIERASTTVGALYLCPACHNWCNARRSSTDGRVQPFPSPAVLRLQVMHQVSCSPRLSISTVWQRHIRYF